MAESENMTCIVWGVFGELCVLQKETPDRTLAPVLREKEADIFLFNIPLMGKRERLYVNRIRHFSSEGASFGNNKWRQSSFKWFALFENRSPTCFFQYCFFSWRIFYWLFFDLYKVVSESGSFFWVFPTHSASSRSDSLITNLSKLFSLISLRLNFVTQKLKILFTCLVSMRADPFFCFFCVKYVCQNLKQKVLVICISS